MEDTPSALRLFYALWPDEKTRAALNALQIHVRGRKLRPANLHLTMAFLGDQSRHLLGTLKELADAVPMPAFDLSIEQLGCFEQQRIAWAGMRNPPRELLSLERELCDALQAGGIGFDRRASFRPHITLARDAPPPIDVAFEPICWGTPQLALVKSEAGPTGVRYEILHAREAL